MSESYLKASLGIDAASGLYGFLGARSKYKAEKKAFNATADNVNEGLTSAYGQNMLRVMQELAAMQQQLSGESINRMRDKATATVAAGEAGAAGNSVERGLGQIDAEYARRMNTIRTNGKWRVDALGQQRRDLYTQARGRILGMSAPTAPNLALSLLDTGANMMASYEKYGE